MIRKQSQKKKKRSPGGLGRGLARILVDSQDPARDSDARSGLLQLVGAEAPLQLQGVRRQVVGLAASTVVDSFLLDGLLLVADRGIDAGVGLSHDLDDQRIDPVVEHLTPALSDGPARLGPRERSRLARLAVRGRPGVEYPVGAWWAVAWPPASQDGIGAVVVRARRFEVAEIDVLAAVVGSLLAACRDDHRSIELRRAIAEGTTVVLNDDDGEIRAEVRADWPLDFSDDTDRRRGDKAVSGRRTGLGRGPDPTTAVAKAAAKACRPRCEVAFAGSSTGDGVEVSIVIIQDPRAGLRLGLAVRASGDSGGAAEAVFTAAASAYCGQAADTA